MNDSRRLEHPPGNVVENDDTKSTSPIIEVRPESGSAFSIGDIYYVLFKHKWMISAFALLGFCAAAAAYRLWPNTVYRSEAKLFIRYIQESATPPSAVVEDAQIKSTDLRGETIINSEMEILTSVDLAKQVATDVGPEKILDVYGGGSSVDAAGNVIHGGLIAQAPRGSRVVDLVFQHPDSAVVQPVLSKLIGEYLKKHVEIHMRSDLFDGVLSKETQALRGQLAKTEEQLRDVQERAGVVSLDETKRSNAEQMSKLREQIWQTSLELKQHQAALEDYKRTQASDKAVPTAKVQEYRNLLSVLETQTKKYQELLTTFSSDSAVLVTPRQHIANNTAAKERLEAEYPALLAMVSVAKNNPARPSPLDFDPAEEQARIRSLTTNLQVLQQDLQRMRKEVVDLGDVELSITDLQRRKDLQESQYRYFSSSLEKTRINEALGSGNVSNISIIQSPTAPLRDVGKLYKVVAGLGCGGLLVGLSLAFCLELFLDQTVRRPGEIETALGLPLFFSIPNVHGGSLSSKGRLGQLPKLLNGDLGKQPKWPVTPKLASYFDALRDNLLFYFDVRGLTKKPKLVAVTSCGDKSGVSTVAAGLAAALSKIGEGNVLLVDMNMGQHAPYHFRNGSAQLGLDNLLDGQDRTGAMVQDKLYAVPHATGNEQLARILPKRFTDLVPRLRSSDYEYIIFDMPPVNQVSVTPQIARFMDMVFLLVESEKTNRGAVKRASGLLAQASCTLGVIVNRTRDYLPRALQEV